MPGPAAPAARAGGAHRAALPAVGALLLALAAAAPAPAAADSPVAEAVEALSSGEEVYAAPDGPEVSAESLALARARLAGAETPVRGALLGGGDPEQAVRAIAEGVGEPGLYIAATEERGATGDTTTTLSWTAVGIDTGGADLEHHFSFFGSGPVEQMIGAVDLLDGDLLPAVREAAAEEEAVYVHPAVAEALPDLDTGALAERFDGLEDTRVAVIPEPAAGGASGGYEEEYAEALLEPVGDEGTALLAVWSGDGFRLTPASGPDGPAPRDLEFMLPLGPGPDELQPALNVFAGAADGSVLADARAALAEDHLYVHPRAGADIGAEERAELDAALAGRGEPIRVAVLPAGARLEAGGDGGDQALADAVAQGLDGGPVVVYALDGEGGIDAYPVHGSVSDHGDYDLETSVFFGLDHGSARASVDGMLAQLGDGAVLDEDAPAAGGDGGDGGGAAAVLPWIGGGVAVLVPAFFLVLGLIGSRGRRRALAEREEERRRAEREEAETMAELKAEEAARAAEIQAENDRGITGLGEALAQAEPPSVDPVEVFETHLKEYERLKEDNGRAGGIDRVIAIRTRIEQARDRLDRWNRRQRGARTDD
ncbi:hypothetical protein [Nocardiopsis potens]|uniref:hypothetical protein n=1 Tax=Nocardiopsis potens TaxID=1246458 RepID=UPI00034B3D42|nr:hypothetical protein [Nocardiopsis potens]